MLQVAGTELTVVDERAPATHVSPNPVRIPLCEMWDDVEEETPAPVEPEPAEEAAPAPAAEAAEPEVAEPPAPEGITYGTEPKKLVFKHWIRPRCLQYGYLYDYQHNYYNDVINYLDRRNKGLPVERPRAQTWGERALRTYLSKSSGYLTNKSSKDAHLLHHISTGFRWCEQQERPIPER
ncbi:unnamed protein product [Arctia plantaginis]|uniref:Flightin n=1 Tax=Arctia plantaginis TaxID=874455 RepID=A0A8S0YZU1_ARCPL|nr:unnamed protein product [Arctia plantaginis]